MWNSRVALGVVTAVFAVACSRSEAATESQTANHVGASGAAAATQDTNAYTVKFEPTGTYKRGVQGVVNVVLTTKADYHINKQYPYKFTTQDPPADGVTHPKHIVPRSDGTFEEKRGVLPVPFVPTKDGELTVGGIFSLSVCTDANCLIDKQPLQTKVKVVAD